MVLYSPVACFYSIYKEGAQCFMSPSQNWEIAAIIWLKLYEEFYKHMKYQFPEVYDSMNRKMMRWKKASIQNISRDWKRLLNNLTKRSVLFQKNSFRSKDFPFLMLKYIGIPHLSTPPPHPPHLI